ncbi:MAG: hypothetical protein MUC77_20960 [Chromatiaceae bacterium]|jgi:hypothetical protein|nr:hypothetical protein [Chromatiaceae bacterium]
MPRVRITRHTVAMNRVAMQGEVLDLAAADADLLVRLGKAVALAPAAAGGDRGQAGETPRPSPAATTESAAALVRGKKRTARADGRPDGADGPTG